MLAPIVIFAFNRPLLLKQLIEALKQNPLYEESAKYIFIDGPRNKEDADLIKQVIEIANTVTTNVIVSNINKGMANSNIDGISDIINRYGKMITLEDDNYPMPGFLTFMNLALDKYQNDEKVFTVCGYGLKINRPKKYFGDVYLGCRTATWGWGTWADRWNSIDWQVSDFEQLKTNRQEKRAFNRGGSDMYGMLQDYMNNRNNSWSIRLNYSQFKQMKYAIIPFLSLTDNNGFGKDATNCRQKYSRFRIAKNHSLSFILPDNLQPNESILRQLRWYHSIPLRIYSKIRKILNI